MKVWIKEILEVFQDDFFSNSLLVENKIQSDLGDIKLRGFISIPSYNKVNQSYQFLFVNGRPVQDRGYLQLLDYHIETICLEEDILILFNVRDFK